MTIVISEELLRSHIRLILIQIWDPIGVKRFGIVDESPKLIDDSGDDLIAVPLQPLRHRLILGDMEAEYDNYIPAITSMILEKKSAKDFYEYLRMLEIENMGKPGNKDVTRNAANRLFLIGQECQQNNRSID